VLDKSTFSLSLTYLSPSKSAYVRMWSHLFGVGLQSIFRAFFVCLFCILNIDLDAISDAILLGGQTRQKLQKYMGKVKVQCPIS